ncbi:hypothetical protein [Streptomyces sp. 891-h]|uniref:hypothetical protein n=1 Tax=unclassified Streptomyces TaxID=2593676 RepID=UPI001FAB20CF|nr:hypothetical protein [Streptomyces sp. 891-h]UNZ17556.1 hypothetical protein HC362_11300 [Streptomyces sp. 891-h]
MGSAATEAEPVPGEPAAADGGAGGDASGALSGNAHGDAYADAHGVGPDGTAPPGGSRLRAWSVGWVTGLAQALGAAVLLITEFVRQDVAALDGEVPKGARLPGYADSFPQLVDTLDGQWWFRAVEAVRDAAGFGEPRAALWAAVCAALVVRLNGDGPPRTQCFLSLAGAFYCLVAALSAIPFLALAGAALPGALVVGVLAVVSATAAPEAWGRVRARYSVASAVHRVRLPPSTFHDQ